MVARSESEAAELSFEMSILCVNLQRARDMREVVHSAVAALRSESR